MTSTLNLASAGDALLTDLLEEATAGVTSDFLKLGLLEGLGGIVLVAGL
jgi:hypothetical protein